MLYVVGMVAVQILLLVVVVVVASTPWFLTHDAYPGMLQSGYSLRLKHADCDVVIYGDSSTLTGLDPDIIQKITGLKTCNLSEGVTIQGVVGSRFPLDSYLANNKRPRYLLAMYTPSMFRPNVDKFAEYQPEGVLYLLQYDRGREMLLWLLRIHGEIPGAGVAKQKDLWVVDFSLWAGRQMVKDLLNRYLPGRGSKTEVDTRAQRESRNGMWPYPLPPETECVRTVLHLDPKSVGRYADSVAEMRRVYGVEGTTVLVNISPLPTCDTLQDAYRKAAEGLHDNAFETLPIADFNEGDVHFSAAGSEHISVEAGEQILALEKQRQTPPSGTGGRAK